MNSMTKEPQFLSTSEVIALHKALISLYGGHHGIRDHGLLDSAIQQCQVTFDGQYLYATIYDMTAAYVFHIIKNHPFIDGNKRTGIMCAIIFLKINGYEFTISTKQKGQNILYEFAIQIALSQLTIKEIATFFKKHSCL